MVVIRDISLSNKKDSKTVNKLTISLYIIAILLLFFLVLKFNVFEFLASFSGISSNIKL